MNKLSYLLLLAMVFSFSTSYAQKCEVSKDPFTNDIVASFDFRNKMLFFEHKNGTTKFGFRIAYGGELNVVMPKGTKISFKLENGETISLTTIDDVAPISQVSSYGVATAYTYIMELNKEEVSKLANIKVTHIRYPDAKGGFIDYESNRKWTRVIMEGAECMLENLNK